MGTPPLNIAVLTSSRADYGIYLPLLRKLKNDSRFRLSIVAFGSHCSEKFGRTAQTISGDGFSIYQEIDNLINDDTPQGIAKSYSKTVDLFADFWDKNNHFDRVFCLGDRFEMAAAVNAGIPFGIKFAHLHGGETTLGAIDNIYRHQITLASSLHFVSLPLFKERVIEIVGKESSASIEVIGALSLDSINEIQLLSTTEFFDKWGVDLSIPTILVTIHPETVNYTKNKDYAKVCEKTLSELVKDYQIVITMPNADTAGSLFRTMFIDLQKEFPNQVILVENFGTQAYFSCMKHSKMLLGNTSSGIVEAASFGKYVINLGNRQKGRYAGENVLHCPFEVNQILQLVELTKNRAFHGENPYDLGGAADRIIETLLENE